MNRIGMTTFCIVAIGLVAALPSVAETAARPDSARYFAVRPLADGFGLADDAERLAMQVRDPLFAFVFTMVERDSLGTWTAADLLAFARAWGEESAFPVDQHLVSLTREPIADRVLTQRGARCHRRWVVRLEPARLEIPMPYSILGYHPGQLSFDTPIVLNEWRLGPRSIHVSVDDQTRRYQADALTVFQIAGGWILLDVDGWIDTLLGRAADDAVMQGFSVAWVDGQLVGVGSSSGRNGRRLLGELDFRSGEVATHGRPVARGLSRYGRQYLPRRDLDPRDVWRRYDDSR